MLFTVDSRYVKGLIDERVLATLLGHMWKVTKQRLRLHIRWVRGHSGGVGRALQTAWQTRAHAGSFSIDGGDDAHRVVNGTKRDS